MVNYQHESYCVYLVVYHIIWCQIRWRKVLVAPIHDRLQEIIEQVIEENAWKLLKLAIQPDHVHLFVRANPYTLPTDIARKIKGGAPLICCEKRFLSLERIPSLWTRRTFYSTAGDVSSEMIEGYIAQ